MSVMANSVIKIENYDIHKGKQGPENEYKIESVQSLTPPNLPHRVKIVLDLNLPWETHSGYIHYAEIYIPVEVKTKTNHPIEIHFVKIHNHNMDVLRCEKHIVVNDIPLYQSIDELINAIIIENIIRSFKGIINQVGWIPKSSFLISGGVLVTPTTLSTTMIEKLKGGKAGIVYAPYVPLIMTP